MATLTVWKYDTTYGADQASEKLQDLAREGLLQVHDAATVVWEADKRKPRTNQLASPTAAGALGGGFFVPLLGAAIGAATGALAGSLSDVGIDDEFINKVRDQVTPGTSALFVLTSEAVLDKIKEAFAGMDQGELIFTDLDSEQEAALREVFA